MINSLLLSLVLPHHNNLDVEEEINEMRLLTNTIGYHIEHVEIQHKKSIDPATYFGKGKITEVFNKIKMLNINIIFVNDELKPNHYKNIKKILGEKIEIIDRTVLILNIFTQNAKTKESKAQVKLATLEYMMPRLTGLWTHLERQMGGTGTTGGPGEKQIEIDRRIIRNDMQKLKKELNNIDKQRNNQKKLRDNVFKISLVGYTNAGKSSLLKKLSGYNAYIKDQLFATLETTTKRVFLPSGTQVIVSDTVGFLRKLPHNLVASFRSTLNEIGDSDLIIKLIDINSSDVNGHIETINNTLAYLDADQCQYLYVFNKIDKIEDSSLFKKINKQFDNPIMLSVLNDLKIDDLITAIDNIVQKNNNNYTINLPYTLNSLIDYIYKSSIVLNRKDEFEYIKLDISCSKENYNKIQKKIKYS